MKTTMKIVMMASVASLFVGCTSAEPRLSHTPNFKAGQADGCNTAQGAYTKNSESFQTDKEYQDGWFYGRKHCNPSN
ncbi:MAG: hypothetical protein GQ531_04670 [Sulfurovum sp.]|nr:hypothetical protein [Sulfurovum sp.]